MSSDLVFSQVSSEYVSPLFPKEGESVELRLFSTQELKTVSVFTNRMGLEWRYDAVKDGAYYRAGVIAPHSPEVLRWYFAFELDDRFYYYSKRGVTVFPPAAKDHFTLNPTNTSPHYIASSTCYQIFPDRFMDGDHSTDVRDGEYTFNGGTVSSHTFDEIPEDYSKARCVDFFNGDLAGIEEKLPYLRELGITVLYINPIMRSRTVHRFDCIDYFNVDEKLGGNEALISLTRKAHEMGIKIIIDISINHTGSDHEWFRKASSDPSSKEAAYYYRNEDGSFLFWQGVDTLPQLNYNCQELRDIVYRKEGAAMRKFLLPPYSIDGWRLDVAPELGRTETDQLCKEVWREVRSSLRSVKPDLYLVGEDWNDASEYVSGDMWDGTMNYYCSSRPLRSWMGERDRFLSSGWGHSPEKEKHPYDAYELASALTDSMNALPDQSRFFQMNLLDSHDTPRLHNNTEVYDEDIYKGVVMALYLLPGMPSIYYGDEISIGGKMGSVEASRYPMVWDEKKWNTGMLEVHRILGKLRFNNDDLAFASFWCLPISSKTLVIMRKGNKKCYLLFMNRAEDEQVHSFTHEMLNGYKSAEDIFTCESTAVSGNTVSVRLGAGKSTVLVLQ
ncbi:MAG: glycoside hydrolase family 13 protein [Bullifex sp.]